MKNFKNNCAVLLAGVSLAFLTGCGNQQTAYIEPPINPFLTASSQGMVPNRDPRADGNNGPLEGRWIRKATDTTCSGGNVDFLKSNINSYSFDIDNQSGSIILTYTSGNIATIPVTYLYTATAITQGPGYPTNPVYPTYPTNPTYPTYPGAPGYNNPGASGSGQMTVTRDSSRQVNCQKPDKTACVGFTEPNVNLTATYTYLTPTQVRMSIDKDSMCSNTPSTSILNISQ